MEQCRTNSVIQVYADISYSESRRKELKRSGHKHCPLTAGLIQRIVKKEGASDTEIYNIKHSNRTADVVLTFKISSCDLDCAMENIKQCVGVGKAETYIF